ncbi:MAG: RecX family transcriptional regulator [Clostridia bacterium]|nr:RecX family transcriptional regulator [Clostridia bacterium]
MNEITAITPQVKDKRRCNVFIDGRFCCGLTLETTVKCRLKVGMTVDPARLAQIQLESEKNTALDKALTYVSATRKTEKQVREFLEKKGYLSAVVDYVIEKMRGYNFINDNEYAEEYAAFAGKKKGSRLIRMELKNKGVSDTDIDGALSAINGEMQEAAAKAVLEKYMRNKPMDKETLYKAFRYLLGKGFEYDVAKSALSAFGDVED